MSDFSEFLGLVENGKIVISVEKPQKEKPVKNSLASSLFNMFALQTTTTTPKTVPQVKKVKAKPQEKQETVKEKPVKKGFFTSIDMKTMEVGKFYRITTNGLEKLYVWLVGASKNTLEVRDYKKVVFTIDFTDINYVEGYTKAVYANR
jgi:hypothetical protein